jgi:AAA+ superfamily predicted ATPase
LGETTSRLARLFDHVRTPQCVLFFDEFDALGKDRGDERGTGESKRVVSSLLLSVDTLPSYVVSSVGAITQSCSSGAKDIRTAKSRRERR